MDEKQAKKILGDSIKKDGLYSLGWYLAWEIGDDEITLDGKFTIEELEAITWWMKNRKDVEI